MDNQKPQITVIGSYAVGMTIYSDRLPKRGETVLGQNFTQLHGGKGSNQAVAVSRLGGNCCFGSCLGNDHFGRNAVSMLGENGVNTDFIKIVDDTGTGVGIVMVEGSGDNSIIIDFGANNHIYKEDVEKIKSVISESDFLLLQLEINLEAVEAAISIAHDCSVPVILNPAPFQLLPIEIIKYTSLLTPNETEASKLLGIAENTIDAVSMAERLYDVFGVPVVVTAGENGAIYHNGSSSGHIKGRNVYAKDTTGAGDVFNAALTVRLGEGKTLGEAVSFANIAASISVTREGVVTSIPYRSEVEVILQQGVTT